MHISREGARRIILAGGGFWNVSFFCQSHHAAGSCVSFVLVQSRSRIELTYRKQADTLKEPTRLNRSRREALSSIIKTFHVGSRRKFSQTDECDSTCLVGRSTTEQ